MTPKTSLPMKRWREVCVREDERADGDVARAGHAVLEDAVDVHGDVAAVEGRGGLLGETVEHHRDVRPAVQSVSEGDGERGRFEDLNHQVGAVVLLAAVDHVEATGVEKGVNSYICLLSRISKKRA